jgi:hypothetical protein
MFQTRKSFKSSERDRAKHSEIVQRNGAEPKKGGGGGSFTWGKPGDELKHDGRKLDPRDPNYDEDELAVNKELQRLERQEERSQAFPPPVHSSSPSHQKFARSISDYTKFKQITRESSQEYLHSKDQLEFVTNIIESELSLYYQDLVYIIIKFGLNKHSDDLAYLCTLILHLVKEANLLTPAHISASIRKLYHQLNDLLIDYPLALTGIRDCVAVFVAGGIVPKSVELDCESTVTALEDHAKIMALKNRWSELIKQFFLSEDGDDFTQSIQDLACEAVNFELIKKLISMSLDGKPHHRELTSRILAYWADGFITLTHYERAFSVLLERVEDLYLDVPDILRLLAGFLARAIVDEILPPAFLVRQDLSERDLGNQVIQLTQKWLQQAEATEKIQEVWEQKPKEDEEFEN